MTSVRLLADDLTGALDTAAELTPLAGSMAVVWLDDAFKAPTSCAIDSGTREKEHDVAIGAVSSLAPALADAEIAYKKVDSLLRGHTMAELAACWRFAAWDHCVVAPAFPFQGRVTVDGVQRVTGPDRHIVADVFALLADAGVEASPGNANALAVALDREGWEEVTGTIAGDDTVLVVAPDTETATRFRRKMLGLIAG